MKRILWLDRPHSAQQGFTLLELLIYIGILVVLVIAVTNMFIPLGRGRGNVVAQGAVHTSMNFVVEKIAQDLREADSITTPPMTMDVNSTATLVVEHLNPTETVEWCVVSGRLYRGTDGTCDGTGDVAITPDTVIVATPTFTRWENTNTDLSVTIASIQFDLTMSYNSTNTDYQYSESKTTTVAMR